jgi:putative ABC transport system permease protein
VLQPLGEQFFGSVREPLYVLAGAVGFVLAIACANAASLLLGRSASRRRELAVRVALGASRARIIRQLLSEAIVLAFAGAAFGIVLAWWGNAWLVSLAPDSVLRLDGARIDASVLLFTLVISVLTGVFFGLVPAWQASRSSPGADLNDASARTTSGRRAGRARDLLVGAEICVALVLLVAAGLLLRSFTALARVNTGIDTRNLLTFDITLSGGRADGPARTAFYDETLRAIRSLPGVRAAGAAVTLPVGGDDFSTYFTVEGQPQPLPGQEPRAGYQIVTPGYFQAMGIEIVRGRDVSDADTADAPQVVLVNETLARQHWPGADPVGRRVRKGGDLTDPWMTVVGVVGDIRHLGPAVPPRPELYEVHRQSPFSFMAFVVRTEGAPERLVPSIRAAVARIDRTVPMARVGTMEAHVERSLSRPRFMSTLTLAFGALALLLALVGVYGLMAHSVAQRTREFAIRTALGARSQDVLGLVVRKALVIAVSGVVVGLAAAAGLSRVLEGMLFGVGATDPMTYLGVSGLMIAVALVASVVPAVRAARVDGAAVLRY